MTLPVWDQEVRGGQNAAMTQLNKNFQKKYPNIKINRVAKSFTDLQATLKLAASGPNPPDVIEANNGYSVDGPAGQGRAAAEPEQVRREVRLEQALLDRPAEDEQVHLRRQRASASATSTACR